MRLLASVITALTSFSLIDIAFASPHAGESSVLKNRHVGRPITPPTGNNISARRASSLEKRFDNAKFSFYDAGRGACGKINSNADFVSVKRVNIV